MKKVILVTGGNRGIGLETCRQLAADDHTVLLGARDIEKGKRAASEIKGDVHPVRLDVTAGSDICALFDLILKEYGRVDVLINNAGIMNDQSTMNVGLDQVKKVMETNVYGPWKMIKAFVPLLEKSDDPRIVNVSSQMGALGAQTSDHSAYRLSKFTLNGLTLQLSHELPQIKINAMHPGWVQTDMGGSSAPRNVEEGADTAYWLATAADISTGKFYMDREIMAW